MMVIDHHIRMVLFVVVRLYQRTLSLLLIPSCRFEPSCSHYALEVLQTWPLLSGLGLILKRLARCQPFCRSGFDPAPPYRGRSGRHRVLFEPNPVENSHSPDVSVSTPRGGMDLDCAQGDNHTIHG